MNRREALVALAGTAVNLPAFAQSFILPNDSAIKTGIVKLVIMDAVKEDRLIQAIKAGIAKYGLTWVQEDDITDMAKQVMECIHEKMELVVEIEKECNPSMDLSQDQVRVMADEVRDYVFSKIDPFLKFCSDKKENINEPSRNS
jgi:hypothetical protein